MDPFYLLGPGEQREIGCQAAMLLEDLIHGSLVSGLATQEPWVATGASGRGYRCTDAKV